MWDHNAIHAFELIIFSESGKVTGVTARRVPNSIGLGMGGGNGIEEED
tara:strand:+ start:216 stop:359 length:144 start_codon:yes stop_codon:yes gene_type:complete